MTTDKILLQKFGYKLSNVSEICLTKAFNDDRYKFKTNNALNILDSKFLDRIAKKGNFTLLRLASGPLGSILNKITEIPISQ